MAIGKLWNFFGTRRVMIILLIQLVLLLAFLHYCTSYQSSDRCVA